MEVKFNAGDMCAIPDGCKATIKDGVVIFEKEEKEEKVQDLKDGDIVILCGRTKKERHPFIFKREDDMGRQKFYVGIDFNNILRTFHDDEYYDARQLHRPTEEEKQELFDKMKEQGLRWNAEEKRVEKIRWRAEKGEKYFTLKGATLVIDFYTENFDRTDEKCHEYGNYFRTEKQAQEAAKRMKKVLRNYHEEIGE